MKKVVLGLLLASSMLVAGCSAGQYNDESKALRAVRQASEATEQYLRALESGDKQHIREASEIYAATVEVDCAIVQSTEFADQCDIFRILSKDAKTIASAETKSDMSRAYNDFIRDADKFTSKAKQVLAR